MCFGVYCAGTETREPTSTVSNDKQALKGEPLRSVFSTDGSFISASAVTHCEGREGENTENDSLKFERERETDRQTETQRERERQREPLQMSYSVVIPS